ncbi:MAG: hypothetical protein QOF67_458 [Mycobacterium sp.]|nr:hypothetical protein [Mycobacterium sp.]
MTRAVPPLNGKVRNLTGPRLTKRLGVTCADLGASVIAPNGKLVSVFGDTFSGRKVGQGDWRSPVVLIGTGDANHEIVYELAGGHDPNYARQLWHYVHDDEATGWTRGGISTVIPSDLLVVDDSIYLHAIVNRGFGNVIWTEIWRSDDSGISWSNMGEDAKFPADLHAGYAQCWSWDYDPDDGWVYVVATGFQRELTFRRMAQGKWILGGFLASNYALGYRVVHSPVANMHTTYVQMPVLGSEWNTENHAGNKVAQLYGGYVLPGSRFDVQGGVGLMVSQWNTAAGWPYQAMQFKAALRDTTKIVPPPDPINL